MAESEKTLDEKVLREDVKDLTRDLVLYGMFVESSWGTLLVKNSERFNDRIDISLSSENGYTVLTVMSSSGDVRALDRDYDEPYFNDTGFVDYRKYVMVLPEEKCRFVQKYGYENIEFSEREKREIFKCLDGLDCEYGVFYSKPVVLECESPMLPEWWDRKVQLEMYESGKHNQDCPF